MTIPEQIEEQRSEDVVKARPESLADAYTVSNERDTEVPHIEDAAVRVATPSVDRAVLRLAYIFEFWIAMIAVFTIWSQVGGQGHLDLLPWYMKLACSVALAWASVRMTAAAVEKDRAWNRSAVRWLFVIFLISGVMAGITYWYHLHESVDEPDSDENSATSVQMIGPGVPGLSARLLQPQQ